MATNQRPSIWISLLLAALASATWLAWAVMLVVVVPKFRRIFEEFGFKLTQALEGVIALSNFFADLWFLLVPLVPLAIFALVLLHRFRPRTGLVVVVIVSLLGLIGLLTTWWLIWQPYQALTTNLSR